MFEVEFSKKELNDIVSSFSGRSNNFNILTVLESIVRENDIYFDGYLTYTIKEENRNKIVFEVKTKQLIL
jgi:hypothetical protein